MLAKRIIPCLDVADGKVVKGVRFSNHQIVGDIVDLAQKYSDQGADELCFYDITASADRNRVQESWIQKVAKKINIPFSVAGGIDSQEKAKTVLYSGADKISVNTPALNRPTLISELAEAFGSQCVVIGIDSMEENGDYVVYSHTGRDSTRQQAQKNTIDWVRQIQRLGAGEIVLNCMNQDGVRKGYDIQQLQIVREICHIPLVASGGAGELEHFSQVFEKAHVDGALAASVFHKNVYTIGQVQDHCRNHGIIIRPGGTCEY